MMIKHGRIPHIQKRLERFPDFFLIRIKNSLLDDILFIHPLIKPANDFFFTSQNMVNAVEKSFLDLFFDNAAMTGQDKAHFQAVQS